MRRHSWLAALVPMLLLAPACGDDDGTDADTDAAEEATTPALTFDGTDCTHGGPTEVGPGVVLVELHNTSSDNASLVVVRLEEGYTAGDLEENIGEEPAAAGNPPPWASDMGGVAPAAPGETLQWEQPLDAGEYGLLCFVRRSRLVWFGTGLTVVEG